MSTAAPGSEISTTGDLPRQAAVSVGLLLALLAAGTIGQNMPRVADGAFASDATLLAPGGPAFFIWFVIYAGLAAYTLWQWGPRNAATPRTRRTGWMAAISLLLNALWLVTAYLGWLWPSAIVLLGLSLVLGVLVRVLATTKRRTLLEAVVVDGTFGLYLGWACVATVANVTTALKQGGLDPEPVTAKLWAIGTLIVVTIVLILVLHGLRGRWAPALGMAWGFAWIAYERLRGQPHTWSIGISAGAAGLLILLAALAIRTNLRQPPKDENTPLR